ncbi:MAG: crotonase/enoyl-CoA hydratase family protein [Gammaproteobacteria bacterium]|nr:crotonase/enoyl-CoA hydratase family protein [Gammaproteobacteria bacterium]
MKTAEAASDAKLVLVERVENVMVITLNRPDARNAVNLPVQLAVGEALEEADQDPTVAVVIITGAGDKSFCAGVDLKALARGEQLRPDGAREQNWGFAGYVNHQIRKPTIAAVNGAAMGGGTELVLASDLAITVESATFGLPEVKRGIMAAAGGVFRVVEQLPAKRAMELVLTGDPIDARQALELGLVNEVVPQSELMDAAMNLARRISANAPLAVQASKRVARGIVDGEVEREVTSWRRARAELEVLMSSEDAKEGARAFAEKRSPVWRAR